jgi:cell division protein FtsI/penicillin-binding protein 2
MRRLFSPAFIVAHLVALHLAVLLFQGRGTSPTSSGPGVDTAASPNDHEHGRPAAPASERPKLRPGPLDLDGLRVDEDGQALADLGNGFVGELTLDSALQKKATRLLERGKVIVGAVVVMDVRTGDVLAMAERHVDDHPAAPKFSDDGPKHLALRAFAPAASVFKVVTAAALLEAGVSGKTAFPYLGGHQRIGADHIGAPPAGSPTATLGDGLSKSINGLFAHLAVTKLEPDALATTAQRFLFNEVVPFPALTDASTAQVPRSPLERGRMAAGFFHSKMTVLHGAVLAAAIARGGEMPAPRFVARLRTPEGGLEEGPAPAVLGRAMQASTATELGRMMRDTTEDGTARRSFSQVPKSLEGIGVVGKTGTLTDPTTKTDYTWFVGYAPADSPQVAFSVLVGNGNPWWVKATDVARDVLAAHFEAVAARHLATR